MLGAIMYWFWEQWSFMESFYFVFISVSTIGFGDIVPDKQSYFIISSIYLFIGLSLVSMCVNVAIEYLNTTIDRAKVRMDKYRGKISEVGKEKMEQVGKQFDKAKVLAKSNFNEARMKATEMKTIARDKATEVRKDFISNVQKEVSKIKKKKKTSIDSNEREGSVPSPGPVRAKSEELYTDTSPSKQHSLDIPDKNISRSRSENVVIPPEQQVVNSVIES
ncbi:hypothetical protein FSP39_010538 [Pinctada imbricata]|uniref:Potassium channel domain-containing protein n=1 Tax=Pinctada imbricata TaxID=66713 RepID=A0AA88Y8V9_PINIB|nr:hypothetical protein FSP39_010538 [Pinctada imbricata]